MVDGVVMCEKDYAELVATWPCLGCGKEIPTGDFLLGYLSGGGGPKVVRPSVS